MPSYVVTGASRGIGIEFVRQLAEDDTNTVFGLVRKPSAATKLQELATKKSNIHIIEADINDYSALKSAAEQVSKVIGGSLDVLINNAAYIDFSNMHLKMDEYDQDVLASELRANFETNVIGTVNTINAFLPLLKKGTTKKVATISSGVGDLELTRATGLSLIAPYSISKAGVNLATAKYAAQYEKDGFIFFSTSPGPTNSAGEDFKMARPEHLKAFGEMFGAYKRAQPNWNGAIHTTEESAKKLLNVIANITAKDNGDFLSQNGDKIWF